MLRAGTAPVGCVCLCCVEGRQDESGEERRAAQSHEKADQKQTQAPHKHAMRTPLLLLDLASVVLRACGCVCVGVDVREKRGHGSTSSDCFF